MPMVASLVAPTVFSRQTLAPSNPSGKRFVFGSPAANAGAPPSIIVTVNAIERR
jgi:hypothetical protein